jgi:hypothetical protein
MSTVTIATIILSIIGGNDLMLLLYMTAARDFSRPRLNQLRGGKRHERTAHLSERVNLSDLGVKYFVDCEELKFVKMTTG